MNKLILILCFCFGLTKVYAQGIFVYSDKHLYGAKNADGKVVIPPQYDRIILDHSYPFYYFYKDSLVGMADSTGKTLIDCKYKDIKAIKYSLIEVSTDSSTAFFNPNLSKFTAFGKLKFLHKIESGLTAYKIDSSLYIHNQITDITTQLPYDSIGYGLNLNDRHTSIYDFFKVNLYFRVFKNRFTGLIDQDGNTIIPLRYDQIELDQGFWETTKDYCSGIYNLKGECLIEANQYSSITRIGKNRYIVENGKLGVCDENGKLIVPNEFEYIVPRQSYYLVSRNHLWGAYDMQGRKKIDLIWSKINVNKNGYFVVEQQKDKGHQTGVLNADGNLIIKPDFKPIEDCEDGYFIQSDRAKKTVINNIGKKIFEGRYSSVRYYASEKLFYVKGNEKDKINNWGVINQFSQQLLDTVYNIHLIRFKNNELNAWKDTSMMVVSLEANGRLIEKILFKNFVQATIDTLSHNHWVNKRMPNEKEDQWVLMDANDKILFPITYLYIDTCFCGNKNITRAYLPQGVSCLIDDNKARYLHVNLSQIESTKFDKQPMVRCWKTNKDVFLLSKTMGKGSPDFRFIEAFENGIARVNINGYFSANDDGFPLRKAYEQLRVYKDYKSLTGGKWGLIDSMGRQLIKCKYIAMKQEFDDKIPAMLDGKWGVINRYDAIQIPFQYDKLDFFTEGESGLNRTMKCKYYKVKNGGLWGVIDEHNNLIIDFKYHGIEYRPTAMGDFFVVEKNNLHGLINISDELVIPIAYTSIDYLDRNCKSYFKVKGGSISPKWPNQALAGYMNTAFEYAVHPQFYDAFPFENGIAKVCLQPKRYSFINTKGELITDEIFDDAGSFSYGKASVKCDGKWGFIDTTAHFLIPFQYWIAGSFYRDIAPVGLIVPPKFFGLISRHYGMSLIDKSGKRITNKVYTQIDDFKDGYAQVKEGNKFGLIDSLGNLCIPIKYKALRWNNQYKLMIAERGQRKSRIYKLENSKMRLMGTYDKIGSFSEGYAWVKNHGKFGYIDSTGSLRDEIEFDFAGDFNCGIAKVGINRKFGYKKHDGKAVDYKYVECSDFRYNFGVVKLGRTAICLDTSLNRTKMPKIIEENVQSYAHNRGILKRYDCALLVDENLKRYNKTPFSDLSRIDQHNYLVKETKDANTYGICDEMGWDVVPYVFKSISDFHQGYSVVKTNHIEGLFDCQGNQLIPVTNLEILYLKAGVVRIRTGAKTQYYNLNTKKML